jgi:hypothetical protein
LLISDRGFRLRVKNPDKRFHRIPPHGCLGLKGANVMPKLSCPRNPAAVWKVIEVARWIN